MFHRSLLSIALATAFVVLAKGSIMNLLEDEECEALTEEEFAQFKPGMSKEEVLAVACTTFPYGNGWVWYIEVDGGAREMVTMIFEDGADGKVWQILRGDLVVCGGPNPCPDGPK